MSVIIMYNSHMHKLGIKIIYLSIYLLCVRHPDLRSIWKIKTNSNQNTSTSVLPTEFLLYNLTQHLPFIAKPRNLRMTI